jgi:hypothetical protein
MTKAQEKAEARRLAALAAQGNVPPANTVNVISVDAAILARLEETEPMPELLYRAADDQFMVTAIEDGGVIPSLEKIPENLHGMAQVIISGGSSPIVCADATFVSALNAAGIDATPNGYPQLIAFIKGGKLTLEKM